MPRAGGGRYGGGGGRYGGGVRFGGGGGYRPTYRPTTTYSRPAYRSAWTWRPTWRPGYTYSSVGWYYPWRWHTTFYYYTGVAPRYYYSWCSFFGVLLGCLLIGGIIAAAVFGNYTAELPEKGEFLRWSSYNSILSDYSPNWLSTGEVGLDFQAAYTSDGVNVYFFDGPDPQIIPDTYQVSYQTRDFNGGLDDDFKHFGFLLNQQSSINLTLSYLSTRPSDNLIILFMDTEQFDYFYEYPFSVVSDASASRVLNRYVIGSGSFNTQLKFNTPNYNDVFWVVAAFDTLTGASYHSSSSFSFYTSVSTYAPPSSPSKICQFYSSYSEPCFGKGKILIQSRALPGLKYSSLDIDLPIYYTEVRNWWPLIGICIGVVAAIILCVVFALILMSVVVALIRLTKRKSVDTTVNTTTTATTTTTSTTEMVSTAPTTVQSTADFQQTNNTVPTMQQQYMQQPQQAGMNPNYTVTPMQPQPVLPQEQQFVYSPQQQPMQQYPPQQPMQQYPQQQYPQQSTYEYQQQTPMQPSYDYQPQNY